MKKGTHILFVLLSFGFVMMSSTCMQARSWPISVYHVLDALVEHDTNRKEFRVLSATTNKELEENLSAEQCGSTLSTLRNAVPLFHLFQGNLSTPARVVTGMAGVLNLIHSYMTRHMLHLNEDERARLIARVAHLSDEEKVELSKTQNNLQSWSDYQMLVRLAQAIGAMCYSEITDKNKPAAALLITAYLVYCVMSVHMRQKRHNHIARMLADNEDDMYVLDSFTTSLKKDLGNFFVGIKDELAFVVERTTGALFGFEENDEPGSDASEKASVDQADKSDDSEDDVNEEGA